MAFKRIDKPDVQKKPTPIEPKVKLVEEPKVVEKELGEKEKRHNERVAKIRQSRVSSKKKTDKEIQQDKTERLMNTIAERASYYRANPHRFVEEFLGIHLKLFQKILIFAMMLYDYFFFVAARGLGR